MSQGPEPTNRYQEIFGAPADGPRKKVVDHMTAYVQDFIRHAPFAVMSTASAEGHCDASPKGGRPGFVKVLDERRLLLPDVRGNNLFQSYANVDGNPHVGLVFFIPGMNGTVRVNGRCQVVTEQDLAAREISLDVFDPDDNAALLQGLLIEVQEAYSHCPRALAFSRLWDTERIEANRADPPVRR